MGEIIKQIKSGRYFLNFYKDGNIICTCKHGSIYVENYKNGERICVHIQRYITKRPTLKQMRVLRELVDFTCQICRKHEETVGILQPHRKKRGNMGGLYIPDNIMMICNGCHKKIHSGEFK